MSNEFVGFLIGVLIGCIAIMFISINQIPTVVEVSPEINQYTTEWVNGEIHHYVLGSVRIYPEVGSIDIYSGANKIGLSAFIGAIISFLLLLGHSVYWVIKRWI